MDGGCSASNNPMGGGASEFLGNLPSRGFFSSSVTPSNPGRMRVYTCDHDTSPPEHQVIKTNQTNILIRSLMLKNQKGDSSTKDGKGTPASQGSRKRVAEKALDGKAAGKKAMSSSQLLGSSQEGSSAAPFRDLHSLTVDKLRALLRENGLSVKGRKDELIARLRAVSG